MLSNVVDVVGTIIKRISKTTTSWNLQDATMPTRFVSTHQMKAECLRSDAELFLAPSLALFSISESSEVKDMSYRGSWGNARTRKSCRSNLSSLGDLSTFDQYTPEQPPKEVFSRPQSPTTSMDDGSWGFFEGDNYSS